MCSRLGRMVPLGTLANVEDVGGPVMVTRYNMHTSAGVNGGMAPGVSSGDALRIITDLADPRGVPFEWTEITYLEIKVGSAAVLVFGLGTLLVYLSLAAKYESCELPLSVILVVPMCLLCAVAGMLIVRLPVNVFVQVGFLVLVGLAAKNAILIVEFAMQLRQERKSRHDAVLDWCPLGPCLGPWGRRTSAECHLGPKPAVRCVGRCDPLIPGPREHHQQRPRCSSVQITSGKGPGSLQPKRATLSLAPLGRTSVPAGLTAKRSVPGVSITTALCGTIRETNGESPGFIRNFTRMARFARLHGQGLAEGFP